MEMLESAIKSHPFLTWESLHETKSDWLVGNRIFQLPKVPGAGDVSMGCAAPSRCRLDGRGRGRAEGAAGLRGFGTRTGREASRAGAGSISGSDTAVRPGIPALQGKRHSADHDPDHRLRRTEAVADIEGVRMARARIGATPVGTRPSAANAPGTSTPNTPCASAPRRTGTGIRTRSCPTTAGRRIRTASPKRVRPRNAPRPGASGRPLPNPPRGFPNPAPGNGSTGTGNASGGPRPEAARTPQKPRGNPQMAVPIP